MITQVDPNRATQSNPELQGTPDVVKSLPPAPSKRWSVNLCIDNIVGCEDVSKYRKPYPGGKYPCMSEAVYEVEDVTNVEYLLQDLQTSTPRGVYSVSDKVKEYIRANFVPKTSAEDSFEISDYSRQKHGGPFYGGYVFLPHGTATVTASTQDEAIDKALKGLKKLFDTYDKGKQRDLQRDKL